MTNEELVKKEQEHRTFLLEHWNKWRGALYTMKDWRVWFNLRLEGVERGLFQSYIVVPEKKKKLIEGGERTTHQA